MNTAARLASWEGIVLLGGFFGLIIWRLFTGKLRLNHLLCGDRRNRGTRSGYSPFLSPGRIQLLLVTILTALYYLLQVLRDPKSFPQIPDAWLAALGGSQAVYLLGKAESMLWGVRDLIAGRNTP